MLVRFYPAECGDAARIHFKGVDGVSHNVFIDSGYGRTYRNMLQPEIMKLKAAGEKIDLWSISHIHDDHIGGVDKYSKDIVDGEIENLVKTWHYNPPRAVVNKDPTTDNVVVSGASSIVQGDRFTQFIQATASTPIVDITTDSDAIDISGLKIKILSPSTHQLQRQRDYYKEPSVPLRTEETEEPSGAAGAICDYAETIEYLINRKQEFDDDVDNGSSIAMLTELDGLRGLWLADSYPRTVTAALKKMGYSKEKPLVCHLVKVAHHGSRGNNSDELYSYIDCENYVISGDGMNKSALPTKECIARILCNPSRRAGRQYKFHFTYDNPLLRSMFDADTNDVFEKYNFAVFFCPQGGTLDFIF